MRRALRGPLVAGTIGSIAVTLGASQAASPFAEHLAGSWFFSLGSAEQPGQRILGVLGVYAGLVLMLAAWAALLQLTARGTVELRYLLGALAAWSAPLLVAPPLFSQDAYAYAADGQLLATGIDPYRSGVSALGRGTFLAHVNPIWRHTLPPYGPGFERLLEAEVLLAAHSLLVTLVLLRLTALASLVAVTAGVLALARQSGQDASRGLALGLLNPLVVLTLLGGMHNDGLMLALLVVGLVLAVRAHPLAGTLCCTLGAEVKAPALIAVVFIAVWSGSGPVSRRLARLAGHSAAALGTLVVIGALSRLGWGWISASVTPGTVVSWLDPATAVGLALAHLAGSAGAHRVAFVDAARVVALLLAAALTIVLLTRPSRVLRHGQRHRTAASNGVAATGSVVAALGLAMLALALLGPVVWPWYETWGIVLAATASCCLRRELLGALVVLSMLGCFADVPSATVLSSGPVALVAGGWALLAALAGGCLLQRWRSRRCRSAASPATAGPATAGPATAGPVGRAFGDQR